MTTFGEFVADNDVLAVAATCGKTTPSRASSLNILTRCHQGSSKGLNR